MAIQLLTTRQLAHFDSKNRILFVFAPLGLTQFCCGIRIGISTLFAIKFLRKTTMSVRAEADTKFLRKYLFIALACVAFAIYCLVDGIVLAPNKMPQTVAYADLADQFPDMTERSNEWQRVVKENDWPYVIPEKTPEELESYIMWQYIMAAGCFLVAIPLVVWYQKTKGTHVEADETAIRGSWGVEVPLDSIESVDKKKWHNKGIAKITYSDAGNQKVFVLDDFKYLREPMGKIMEIIESKVAPQKILNDKPADQPSKSSD